MLETLCVGDNFKMLVTCLVILVTNIHKSSPICKDNPKNLLENNRILYWDGKILCCYCYFTIPQIGIISHLSMIFITLAKLTKTKSSIYLSWWAIRWNKVVFVFVSFNKWSYFAIVIGGTANAENQIIEVTLNINSLT